MSFFDKAKQAAEAAKQAIADATPVVVEAAKAVKNEGLEVADQVTKAANERYGDDPVGDADTDTNIPELLDDRSK